jgi:hypothetical protein
MCSPCTDAKRVQVAPLDPASFARHRIHTAERDWAETNCYTDVMIEMLHALGFEPAAMLAFTLAVDFEGDQWTFFKPPHADLAALYGFDIEELAVWRPLTDHIEEQLALGRPVLVELDSYYLPDTAGTTYRRVHQKSGVAVNAIDTARPSLGYFHNQGYYALDGDDFSDVFQTDGRVHERMLPPYVEFIKWRPGFRAPRGRELREASEALLARHVARIPRENPFPRFKERFAEDLGWLLGADIDRFHAYSFATFRQYGACFELAATYLRWLEGEGRDGLDAAIEAIASISHATKAYQFQLARAIAHKKPLELGAIDEMAAHWERGMGALTR